jgi:hypothetical protein
MGLQIKSIPRVFRLLVVAGLALVGIASGQTNHPSGADHPATKAIGTLTSITDNVLVLKTDVGGEVKVVVPETARILLVDPGAKDLKDSSPVTLKELKVEDRVLASGKTGNDGSFQVALLVIMKQTAVLQKQARERADWQKRGVGGIVRAIDAATGEIVISTAPLHSVLVKTTKTTAFSRYSQESVRFSDARQAVFAEINVGDQIRARGNSSPDGKELTAEQVISGTFRNIAGTVVSVDIAQRTLTVKDVLVKKTVVVRITDDSHLQQLPMAMAQRLASLLKKPPQAEAGKQAGAVPGAEKPGIPPDLQQVLSKVPVVALSEFRKDGAVIIVSTMGNGSDGLKAISVLGGVEPVLMASPDSDTAAILSDWNLFAALNDSAAR